VPDAEGAAFALNRRVGRRPSAQQRARQVLARTAQGCACPGAGFGAMLGHIRGMEGGFTPGMRPGRDRACAIAHARAKTHYTVPCSATSQHFRRGRTGPRGARATRPDSLALTGVRPAHRARVLARSRAACAQARMRHADGMHGIFFACCMSGCASACMRACVDFPSRSLAKRTRDRAP